MKLLKIIFLILIVSFVNRLYGQELADELLVLHSTTNVAQMNNISSPIAGSMVYNTENSGIYFYTGTNWKKYAFVPTPYITNKVEENINSGETKTVVFEGVDFTPSTILTIPGFDGSINSIDIISPRRIEVNITANSSGLFDIVVDNEGHLNTTWSGNGVGKLRVN